MLLFLRDNRWFSDDIFRSIVQALDNTAGVVKCLSSPAAEIKSTAALPYVKGLSEPLRPLLKQHCVRPTAVLPPLALDQNPPTISEVRDTPSLFQALR